MKIFLSGIFLFAFLQGEAQLTITKDYNACLYGLTDASGNWVVKPKYTFIHSFYGGIAIVMLNNAYGLINYKGEEVVAPQYDEISNVVYSTVYTALDENRATVAHSSVSTNYGTFEVKKSGLYGLMDSKGEILLPIQYKYIGIFYYGIASIEDKNGNSGFADFHGTTGIFPDGFFEGCSNGQFAPHLFYIRRYTKVLYDAKKKTIINKTLTGLYNDSARLVVPIEFDSINLFAGNNDIIEVYKNGKIGYYSISGKKIWDAIYTIPNAQMDKAPALSTFGSVAAFNGMKWGVIDKNGNSVFEFKYDSIIAFPLDYYHQFDTACPVWKVQENNKWGIANKQGKWMLPPTFESVSDVWWNLSQPKDVPEFVFQLKSAGYWGSLSSSGREIVAFEFDTVFKVDNNLLFWSEDEKMILTYRKSGNYVVQVDYDYLAEAKRLEEIAMKSNDDMDYTPDVIDLFHADIEEKSDTDKYRFAKRLPETSSMTVIHPQETSSANPNVHFFKWVNDINNEYNGRTYYSDQEYRPEMMDGIYYGPAEYSAIILTDKKGIHNLYFLNNEVYKDSLFHYFIVNSTSPGLVRSDGEILIAPGTLKKIQPFYGHNGKFIVQTNSLKQGVIDMNGKILADTLWEEIRDGKGDSIWVEKHDNSKTKRTASSGDWNLLSLRDGKLLLDKKDQLTWPCQLYNKVSIAFTVTGIGLLDVATFKFVVKPTFQSLYWLSIKPAYLVATTCHGNMGIVDGQGNWVTDTTWKYIVETYSARPSAPTDLEMKNKTRYLLSNDTTWAIFDTETGFQKKNRDLLTKIIGDAITQPTHPKWPDRNYCPNCPWLENAPASYVFKPWQQDALFKILYDKKNAMDYRYSNGEKHFDCSCIDYRLGDASIQYEKWGGVKRLHNKILFINDSCLSIETLQSDQDDNQSKYDSDEDRFFYKTVFLFPAGPREMTLDSLFKGEAWRNTIANGVLDYLKQHPGIDANCSNPIMYAKFFTERFALTPEGVLLYPEYWLRTDGKKMDKIEILIPWSSLKNDLRADVASKLGMGN